MDNYVYGEAKESLDYTVENLIELVGCLFSMPSSNPKDIINLSTNIDGILDHCTIIIINRNHMVDPG